jgi:hypothetical protein
MRGAALMDRRGFMGAILAAGMAPAIVRAESLMRCRSIVLPTIEETLAVVVGFDEGRPLLNLSLITREVRQIMKENTRLSAATNQEFERQYLLGDVLHVRRPLSFFKPGA